MILSHRIYTATLIGLSGALVMMAMSGPRFEPGMVVTAGVGAFGAGLPVAGLFGRKGRPGHWAAAAGAVLATGAGALLAGCVLALITGFGGAVLIAPAVVASSIMTEPVAALVWLVSMASVHVLTRMAHEEMDFGPRYSRK